MSGDLGLATRRRLWFSSGGVCAFPGCDQLLMALVPDETDLTNVAHECHIVARKDDPKVARSVSLLTDQEKVEHADLIENRHGFSNVVLMCATHSCVIDDPKQGYSVSRMIELKRDHERRVNSTRSQVDMREAQAEYRYATIVDAWARRICLDEWDAALSPLVADGHPRIDRVRFDAIDAARTWIFKMAWPRANPRLEAALENFRRVAQDLVRLMTEYPHDHLAKQGVVAIRRFYNDPPYQMSTIEPGDTRLGEMYEFYSQLVEDQAFELTRSVNLVCDVVRQTLDPLFRVEKEVATLTEGTFTPRTSRPEYASLDDLSPYPGLRRFLEVRSERDIQRGHGSPPHGLQLPGDSLFI